MLWLVVLTTLAQAQAPSPQAPLRRFVPIQADLSGVGSFGARSAAGVALYVGAAVGSARPPWGTPFGGVGFEIVYQLTPDPYRISYGVQLRAGYAWSAPVESGDVHPDVMLYARVTPFYSTTALTFAGEVPADLALNSFGLRGGVGVTVPGWTKFLLFGGLLPQTGGFGGETLRVLASLLLAPFAIVNHAELTVEVLTTSTPIWTFTFRIGAGF